MRRKKQAILCVRINNQHGAAEHAQTQPNIHIESEDPNNNTVSTLTTILIFKFFAVKFHFSLLFCSFRFLLLLFFLLTHSVCVPFIVSMFLARLLFYIVCSFVFSLSSLFSVLFLLYVKQTISHVLDSPPSPMSLWFVIAYRHRRRLFIRIRTHTHTHSPAHTFQQTQSFDLFFFLLVRFRRETGVLLIDIRYIYLRCVHYLPFCSERKNGVALKNKKVALDVFACSRWSAVVVWWWLPKPNNFRRKKKYGYIPNERHTVNAFSSCSQCNTDTWILYFIREGTRFNVDDVARMSLFTSGSRVSRTQTHTETNQEYMCDSQYVNGTKHTTLANGPLPSVSQCLCFRLLLIFTPSAHL